MRVAVVFCLLVAPAFAGELPNKERKALEKQLAAASAPEDVARIVAALAADDSKRAVRTIYGVALQSTSVLLYRACVEALATVSKPKAVAALFTPLEKPTGDVRRKILAADALALRADAVSVDALTAALEAKHQREVLRAVLAALEDLAPPAAVDALIEFYERVRVQPEEADGMVVRTVFDLLVTITGRGFDNGEDWRKYWLTKKAQGARSSEGGTGERAFGSKAATFFGSEIRSNRLVFVIDASNSMEGERLGSAKEQLKLAVDGLGSRSTFTILAFARTVRPWRPTVQAASAENKESAKTWVDALTVEFATNSLLALQTAFKLEGPDTIVFLTDGRPTDREGPTAKSPKLSIETILEQVATLNRWKRWRIDTFGFLKKKKGKRRGRGAGGFLKKLAAQSGGEFTSIR